MPSGHSAITFVPEGEVGLLGQRLVRGPALPPSEGPIVITAAVPSRDLLLSGKPHGEPIRQRAPFGDERPLSPRPQLPQEVAQRIPRGSRSPRPRSFP